MKKILTILFLFISGLTRAQQTAMLSLDTYGGNGSDSYYRVNATFDGGFILSILSSSTGTLGNIDSFCGGSSDRIIFKKYNADASLLEWSKCYGSIGDSSFLYLFPQQNGDVVLGGNFSNSGGLIIQKQNVNGNILWQKEYSRNNGPSLKDMIQTTDGGFLLLSEAYYIDTNVVNIYGGIEIWALKLDSLGNKEWSKNLGGTDEDVPRKVLEISSGGYYIVGTTR